MSEPESKPWYKDWKNVTIAALAVATLGVGSVAIASSLSEDGNTVTLGPGEQVTVTAGFPATETVTVTEGGTTTDTSTTEPTETQPTEPTDTEPTTTEPPTETSTTEPTTTTEPPPTTTEPPPTTTTTEPPPTGQYDLVLVDKTFVCTQRYNGYRVKITITGTTSRHDAVFLNDGCSGDITLEATILKGWDCIKVHRGAVNLTVRGFCEIRDRVGDVHQDFIQAMGGGPVTFKGFVTRTAGQAGANGGGGPGSIHSSLFVNRGAGDAERPTGIVCDGCNLNGGGSPVWVNEGTNSGARNSTIQRGYSGRCVNITAEATNGINSNNTCTG